MAFAGHDDVQLPQPMHTAPCTSALLSLPICGAKYGHTCTQVMQAMHLFGSTHAVCAPTGITLRDNIDAARPATALACDMVSLMNLGACAVPHRKRPSLAKSTGRSFTCASKKNPSALSVTRKSSESCWRSSRATIGEARTSRSGFMVNSRPSTLSNALTVSAPDSETIGGLSTS